MGTGYESKGHAELHHTRMTMLSELDAIATESQQFACTLRIPQAKTLIEDLVLRSLWQLLQAYDPTTAKEEMQWIQMLIKVGDRLQLAIQLDRAQELYFQTINKRSVEELFGAQTTQTSSTQELSDHLNQLVEFGRSINLAL